MAGIRSGHYAVRPCLTAFRRRRRAPSPLAPEIAVLGYRRRGEAGAPHRLEPIYVRRPDAELERERRQQP